MKLRRSFEKINFESKPITEVTLARSQRNIRILRPGEVGGQNWPRLGILGSDRRVEIIMVVFRQGIVVLGIRKVVLGGFVTEVIRVGREVEIESD